MHVVGADDAACALIIRVTHTNIDDPWVAADLLEELRAAGAADAARTLADRAAVSVELHSPVGVAALLEELIKARADGATQTLTERAAAHISLDDPSDVVRSAGGTARGRG